MDRRGMELCLLANFPYEFTYALLLSFCVFGISLLSTAPNTWNPHHVEMSELTLLVSSAGRC